MGEMGSIVLKKLQTIFFLALAAVIVFLVRRIWFKEVLHIFWGFMIRYCSPKLHLREIAPA